ncbi:MAG: S9 family peptidase, partial [Ardenticatenia bacterium]|nr:S9 family peptidase [Ardenticatenia bacterium]
MAEFRRFLSVRNAFGGTLAPDGRRLAFLTDITGTSQIWTLDGPEQWPDQRSFDDDRITFVRYSPRRRLLLFGQDHGGNEMDQLFVMDDEGTFVRPLAPKPERKHILADWSPDGRTVAFTANRDHVAQLDVYTVDVERPDEVRRVFTGDGWNYVAAWLPDGQHAIVGQSTSNTNNTLYLLNLA